MRLLVCGLNFRTSFLMLIIAPDALRRKQCAAAWIAAYDGRERHLELCRDLWDLVSNYMKVYSA